MELPTPVAIPGHLHRKLLKANQDMLAVDQMMKMFQANCSARIAEAQAGAREAWDEIRKAVNIDTNDINWEPHPVEPVIVPTQMRIRG